MITQPLMTPYAALPEEEDEDEDENNVIEFIKSLVGYVYGLYEGPIDLHLRTDRENCTIVVCEKDPIKVTCFTGNSTDYWNCDEDSTDASILETVGIVSIDQPFEADMLSRAFINHILLNPALQSGNSAEPERTES